ARRRAGVRRQHAARLRERDGPTGRLFRVACRCLRKTRQALPGMLHTHTAHRPGSARDLFLPELSTSLNRNSFITNTLNINECRGIFHPPTGGYIFMSKQFASHADLEDKVVSFEKLSDNAYAYTAEGDPNTGIIVGDDAVMVIDTQATPVMAQDVIKRVREVTDKPIKYILLSHYHAVRVLGASAYNAQEIIAS